MSDRISTFIQTGNLIGNNMRLQTQYAEGQVQISSGLKSQSFEGIAQDTRRLLSLHSDYKRLETQTENAKQVQTRIDLMYDSMGTIIDYSTQFAADLTAAISNVVNNTADVQNTAQNLLEQTASVLNVNMGGRFLFGGSATKTVPVDLNAVGFGGAVIPSAPNTLYYQGNGDILNVELDDNYSVNYGFTADDPAMEMIIRAYDLVRTTPADQATLEEAHDLLSQGIDLLAEERAALSQSSSTIANKIQSNEEELLLLENLAVDINEVDVADVSVRMQEIELQIEASYSVTTRIIKMNIMDYL